MHFTGALGHAGIEQCDDTALFMYNRAADPGSVNSVLALSGIYPGTSMANSDVLPVFWRHSLGNRRRPN